MSLFNDANRRLFAITELCNAVTTLAVQAYNAGFLDSEIRIKFLASDKQRRFCRVFRIVHLSPSAIFSPS